MQRTKTNQQGINSRPDICQGYPVVFASLFLLSISIFLPFASSLLVQKYLSFLVFWVLQLHLNDPFKGQAASSRLCNMFHLTDATTRELNQE
uniref:Uncharacterized protein n=1 Tax=Rhizophora mucronata TaxID=61149 RepID=A0A2P2KQI1_RHIMU